MDAAQPPVLVVADLLALDRQHLRITLSRRKLPAGPVLTVTTQAKRDPSGLVDLQFGKRMQEAAAVSTAQQIGMVAGQTIEVGQHRRHRDLRRSLKFGPPGRLQPSREPTRRELPQRSAPIGQSVLQPPDPVPAHPPEPAATAGDPTTNPLDVDWYTFTG
ncbi:hypothetical protein [Actinomadura violacea]|uniref:Uncharacterized protein n=1 Tax=Actinomadura violacea TaxID=2819934 RepID=A0ABS3RN91_9ACTN|nr:hypothetical protein [Actinomadura violacea]MBO2458227.1 hypothetical protein [Actinomadura violacea]